MRVNQRKAGVILSYLSEAIKILTGLIYTPVMLRLLGQSEYGLYQLVNSVVSYLGLLSMGFGSSYMRFYSRYKAKKDEEGIARLNGMFMVIFCSISVICIICGVIMLGNIQVIFGEGLTSAEYEKAKVLMGLMVVNLALTFPNSVFNCNITAHEQFFFQKILSILQGLLNPFLTLPLLIMGVGSVGMVSVSTFLTVAVLITNIFFCYKKLHISFIYRGFQFSLLKEMWIFTFFIFLNQIVDQINWSVDKFLLGRIAGTVSVAVYGVGGQINTMYLQLSNAVSNVFVPRVNQIVSESEDNHELDVLFTRIGRIQFMILALIISGFVFFGKPFIKYWAGEGYDSAYYITLCLIVPVTVPLIQNIGLEIQRAKNMHKARSVVYLAIAIGNVFISIPLIMVYGAVGAAIGTAISVIAGNVLFMNWYYQCKIGLDMYYFWKNIVRFIPALILPSCFGVLLMIFVEFSSMFALLIGIALYLIVYCVSMWFWGMNDEEKQLLTGPLHRIMKK